MKDISIEYAHIYTDNRIGDEQRLSVDILGDIKKEHSNKDISLVVMIDDYSFPDPSFNYEDFAKWLDEKGFKPDIVLRESQLIPLCDEVLKLIHNKELEVQISDYVRTKKYPCSLFVATWYLLRLGCIQSSILADQNIAASLINILPESFKPFEEKAFEIIRSTQYADKVDTITNKYFKGRLVA